MNPSNWKQIKDALGSAMDLGGSEREEFLDSLADDIRAEVVRLLAADERAKDFIETPIVVERSIVDHDGSKDPAEGTVIDGYRLIRKIGTGGMGAVYLAEHSGDGYTQIAALKLIKRGMDSSAVLKRFLMERQILANLEHPNIARMLDGGSTEDGVPYFVMEYVDGAEIRRFCDDNRFGLNDRLMLFRKVCGAVANAHQKLVVHRDLKPSNILVTKDGEPKLLDFGIAKLLSPDWNTDTHEATLTQFRVMTPEYASPEQIAGDPTSTSTDIYSLGVILYELLSGRKPYDTRGKGPKEIVENVLSKEPPRPSTAGSGALSDRKASTDQANDPDTAEPSAEHTMAEGAVDRKLLQGDLDNIILKALRREPERRYQSVQELSEDIRRFQDGLPVSATADSRSYRFQKFYRRHRAGVLGAAAAAAVLLGATAVTGWQYSVAERERAVAEQRFAETRVLAKKMLYDLHDKIKEVPGSTAAREYLVESALTYIDSLAAEKIDDPDLQSELSDAYQRIGDIQGGLWQANLGEREKAEQNYAKATAIMETLVEKHPDRHRFKWKLGQLYAAAADAAYQKTDMPTFAALSAKALEQWVPIESNFDSDEYYQFYVLDLIAGYYRSARGKAVTNELDAAYELAVRGSEVAKVAKERLPGNYPIKSAGDTMTDGLAEVLMLQGRFEEALKLYQDSLKSQEAEGEAGKEYAQHARRNRMLTLSSVAKLQGLLERYDDALPPMNAALEMAVTAAADDPLNADSQMIVANFTTLKGMILQRAGREREAIPVLGIAIEKWRALRAADPENQVYRYMESDATGTLGKAHLALGLAGKKRSDLLIAREMLEKAFAVNKEFRDEGISSGAEAAETDVLEAKLRECLIALGMS